MIDFKEQTLREALRETSLRELPKRYDDSSGDIWIKAIVLVRKRNCTQSYALARRRGDGLISYVRDYGQMSPIAGLVSIHPYMYLDKERFLYFKNDEQKRTFLANAFGWEEASDIMSMSEEKINAKVIDAAIMMQERSSDFDLYNNAAVEGTALECENQNTEGPAPEPSEIIPEEDVLSIKEETPAEQPEKPKMETEADAETFETIASAKSTSTRKRTTTRRKTTARKKTTTRRKTTTRKAK